MTIDSVWVHAVSVMSQFVRNFLMCDPLCGSGTICEAAVRECPGAFFISGDNAAEAVAKAAHNRDSLGAASLRLLLCLCAASLMLFHCLSTCLTWLRLVCAVPGAACRCACALSDAA